MVAESPLSVQDPGGGGGGDVGIVSLIHDLEEELGREGVAVSSGGGSGARKASRQIGEGRGGVDCSGLDVCLAIKR